VIAIRHARFFPADAAVARAAVWIAMRAAVVAGFATLRFRAFASGERFVEGGVRPHDIRRAVVRY
jgi:hypothetical protein